MTFFGQKIAFNNFLKIALNVVGAVFDPLKMIHFEAKHFSGPIIGLLCLNSPGTELLV